MLDKIWDDVLAGPQPERGLGKFRKINTLKINSDMEGEGSSKLKSLSVPSSPSGAATPTTPTTPSTPSSAPNVWRSVFNPGSNLATRGMGYQMYDKPQPNSPTVYDWNT